MRMCPVLPTYIKTGVESFSSKLLDFFCTIVTANETTSNRYGVIHEIVGA